MILETLVRFAAITNVWNVRLAALKGLELYVTRAFAAAQSLVAVSPALVQSVVDVTCTGLDDVKFGSLRLGALGVVEALATHARAILPASGASTLRTKLTNLKTDLDSAVKARATLLLPQLQGL